MESSPPQLHLDPAHPDSRVLHRAAETLRNGNLIIIPTETVYGLAGDPRHPAMLEKIYKAKGRPEDKPIPLFAANIDQIISYGAQLNATALALAKKFWPGPLTLVLPTGTTTTGFRVPDYPIALELVKIIGSVLAVTSANHSGEPPAIDAASARTALGPSVTMILDAGPSPGGVPSTVVKVIDDRIEILREGAIPAEKIKSI